MSPSIQVVDSHLQGQGDLYVNSFYTAIVIKRIETVFGSAFDSFTGKVGYSCLHDCGPHGSCRCGLCVKGGNELNCNIPDCAECGSGNFIFFIIILFPMLSAIFLLGLFIVRTLVTSANFHQEDLFAILGYRCCLFNARLFRYRSLPRTLKSFLGRASVLWMLPPLPMIVLSLASAAILFLVFMSSFWKNIEFIYSILPEELFPSDHMMVVAEITLVQS